MKTDTGDSAKPRAKPRVKKPLDEAQEAARKAKRRRAAQKRREQAAAAAAAQVNAIGDGPQPIIERAAAEMTELPLNPDSLHLLQHLHEGQRYDRAPRPLPDVPGIKSLSASEAQHDVKHIQQALAAFEARAGIKLPDARPGVGDQDHRRLYLKDGTANEENGGLLGRRARPNSVLAPEEIVETLPAARRAVRITQRELRAMKVEREDLERAFVRHRCTLVWQVSEMKRMKKQQERVQRALCRDVVRVAKDLESSRRRTSALQDIMTELEARGSSVVRLTREKRQLEALLEAKGLELPEIDEVCVGDRVDCSGFGRGKVVELRVDARQVVVELDAGGRAYVQEEDVKVLPSDMTYVEADQQLRERLFEKIGALVQPNGKLRMLNGAFDFTADDSEEDEDEDSSEEDSSDEETKSSGNTDKTSNSVDAVAQDGADKRKSKKRKLIMKTPPGAAKKKAKNRQLIEFPASTVPITPYDTGLLISPLSELPERVAAVGPNALQWLPSYLPKNMDEWEQERYESLQMKGELERLRFQLQKAEAEKLDAQQHASDQLESINQLVAQLDKLRDNAADACPHCGHHSGGRKGSSKAHRTQHHGRGAQKKDTSVKRSRDDTAEDELSETNSKSSKGERDENKDVQRTVEDNGENDDHDDKEDEDENNESSDATSSRPTTRSLRPRRKPTTSS